MEEIEKNVIDVAEGNGFTLTEPIDFTHEKKVLTLEPLLSSAIILSSFMP